LGDEPLGNEAITFEGRSTMQLHCDGVWHALYNKQEIFAQISVRSNGEEQKNFDLTFLNQQVLPKISDAFSLSGYQIKSFITEEGMLPALLITTQKPTSSLNTLEKALTTCLDGINETQAQRHSARLFAKAHPHTDEDAPYGTRLGV
jgi:hypothetical protein